MKKFKNVRLSCQSEHFDIEISDEELEEARSSDIDINDEEELLRFHLESNFKKYTDLLYLDNFQFETEESKENDEN